jgi:hypothetical protein
VSRAKRTLRVLRIWWRNLRCPHSRTVKFFPDCSWERDGRTMGSHKHVLVRGCLDCRRVLEVVDFGQ